MTFFVIYARLANRSSWLRAAPIALLCWLAVAWASSKLLPSLTVALFVAVTALAVSPIAMGRRGAPATSGPASPWELPARMACGAALTLVTSALGRMVGPEASGLAALFPVVGGVVAAFAHATQGAPSAQAFLFGMTRGMWSVGVFCTMLALLLPRSGTLAAFAAAFAVTLVAHAVSRPRRDLGARA
jgi:hypothetical protein